MAYAPKKLYVVEEKTDGQTTEEEKTRMFHEFYTGNWWWQAQVSSTTI